LAAKSGSNMMASPAERSPAGASNETMYSEAVTAAPITGKLGHGASEVIGPPGRCACALSSQPLQPPGGEQQCLLGLGIRRAAQLRAVVDRILACGRAGLLLRDLCGRWSTDAPGECG